MGYILHEAFELKVKLRFLIYKLGIIYLFVLQYVSLHFVSPNNPRLGIIRPFMLTKLSQAPNVSICIPNILH